MAPIFLFFEPSPVSVLVHGAIETSTPPCLVWMGSTPRFHAEAGVCSNHQIFMIRLSQIMTRGDWIRLAVLILFAAGAVTWVLMEFQKPLIPS